MKEITFTFQTILTLISLLRVFRERACWQKQSQWYRITKGFKKFIPLKLDWFSPLMKFVGLKLPRRNSLTLEESNTKSGSIREKTETVTESSGSLLLSSSSRAKQKCKLTTKDPLNMYSSYQPAWGLIQKKSMLLLWKLTFLESRAELNSAMKNSMLFTIGRTISEEKMFWVYRVKVVNRTWL